MKIKFDFQLTDINGNQVEGESHAGKILASLLYRSNLGDSIKFASWALELYKPPHEIEITVTEKEILTGWLNTINKDPRSMVNIQNGILAQFVNAIEKQANQK